MGKPEEKSQNQIVSILTDLKNKGYGVGNWIIEGKSALKYLNPDISKIIQMAKNLASVNHIICENHGIQDILVDDNGIFCKNCGKELVLVPAWVVGYQKNAFKEDI